MKAITEFITNFEMENIKWKYTNFLDRMNFVCRIVSGWRTWGNNIGLLYRIVKTSTYDIRGRPMGQLNWDQL